MQAKHARFQFLTISAAIHVFNINKAYVVFSVNANPLNDLCFSSGYVTDGCPWGFCGSAVGPRDHGPGGVEFWSRWHNHRTDHDVMWLVVWTGGGPGRLVSGTLCSGKWKTHNAYKRVELKTPELMMKCKGAYSHNFPRMCCKEYH